MRLHICVAQEFAIYGRFLAFKKSENLLNICWKPMTNSLGTFIIYVYIYLSESSIGALFTHLSKWFDCSNATIGAVI